MIVVIILSIILLILILFLIFANCFEETKYETGSKNAIDSYEMTNDTTERMLLKPSPNTELRFRIHNNNTVPNNVNNELLPRPWNCTVSTKVSTTSSLARVSYVMEPSETAIDYNSVQSTLTGLQGTKPLITINRLEILKLRKVDDNDIYLCPGIDNKAGFSETFDKSISINSSNLVNSLELNDLNLESVIGGGAFG